MKKRITFSKGFLPCAILSCLVIVSGIFSFVTRGINLGIDFKPGTIEEVTIKGAAGIEDVRDSLAGLGGVSVKKVGSSSDTYQIRAGVEESEGGKITQALVNKYGEGNVDVLKTDFIGSSMSSSLARQSIFLLLGTMLLIWVYATVRFHWDFALGAIVALVHDICIMFTFITWSQIEFSTTTLAAVLTIVGYSINATVVILDRVRYNLPLMEVKTFKDLLNQSLSDTLARSIITTVTTLFAVMALYIFTTGSIKDFALAMTVGLLSGCYSSIFISSGFINFTRRDWKPEYGIHHAMPKKVQGAAV
ncbi:MAG: protein translocase subunit SecF [Treponema sp.]|nr:protein translocase subunit SecF [Treponema sp.]MBR5964753.1 protein translocase subunit SecF [Treponema sp.]